MKKIMHLLSFALLSLVLFSCGGSGGNTDNTDSPSSNSGVKIAIIGDQSISDNAHKLLKMIKDEGVELLVINGDFDYKNNPAAWKKMHDDVLGTSFPIIAVAGNHDADDSWELWQEYQRITADWDANPNLSCTGTPGEESTCVYKGIKIVSVTPNQFDYEHTKYIKQAFDGDDNSWKICAWHKNMTKMQTGDKLDEAGWGVYDACREQGALITTAHEHAYARSFLFSDIENQVIADNNPNSAKLSKGKTIVILSGLGGKSSRPLQRDDSWWAHRENANTGAVAGALICSFGKKSKADCYFKDIKKGIVDTFTLTK
jgi:predicted phosphodiesterase